MSSDPPRQEQADRSGERAAFTLRDEANAMTAYAFRNGVLEELHAGRRSALLDDPENSRITDDEMKRLMIDASQKVEVLLRLREAKPDAYEAFIREYWSLYCRRWTRR